MIDRIPVPLRPLAIGYRRCNQNNPALGAGARSDVRYDGKNPTIISILGRMPPSANLDYVYPPTTQPGTNRRVVISMSHEDFDEYRVDTVLFARLMAVEGVISVAVML